MFPLGVVVGGPFLPLAIILYWFANNIWTFGQQHYVFGMIEKEEEAKKQEAIQRRAANAPAPGAKPKRVPRASAASGNGVAAASGGSQQPGPSGLESDGHDAETKPPRDDASEPKAAGTGNPGNRAPRPGAKPRKRKR